MRIIQCLGPSHRDDGAPYYIKGQLNLIPNVVCDRKSTLEPESTWGEYDAHLHVDWGQDAQVFDHLPRIVPNPNKKSLCWQSDTHWWEHAMQYRIDEALHYKVAAFCQPDAARLFSTGPNPVACIWLPHAADHTVYTPPLKDYGVNLTHLDPEPGAFDPYCHDILPRYDVCFIGHPDDEGRRKVLATLFKAIPNFCWLSGAYFRACSRQYHQSKIVFNKSVRGELNMRTFEALAARTFLLTDRQQGMDDLGLKDGVHCAMYESDAEMIDKARWYLDSARDEKRRVMARQGWEWVLAGHTYWHRARTIVRLLT